MDVFPNFIYCLCDLYIVSIAEQLANEIDWDIASVTNTLALFDDDHSLHFIARYRKNVTGGMDSEVLNFLHKRFQDLKQLEDAKQKARKKLAAMGKDDEFLLSAIDACSTLSDVRELIAPFRSKRETKASKARELGLQIVADIIMGKLKDTMDNVLADMNTKNPIKKCQPIIAEESISHPQMKRVAEAFLINSPFAIKYREQEDKEGKYRELSQLTGKVIDLSPHQIMALFRAQDEGMIRFQFKVRKKKLVEKLREINPLTPHHKYHEVFYDAFSDGISRLLLPRAKRAVLKRLKETADQRAIDVFKTNLEHLLLQPPIVPKIVLAIDPGYINGCKVAIVDRVGRFLTSTTIYPTEPKNKIDESTRVVLELIDKYNIELIVIGNGTASKETAEFVGALLKSNDLYDINYAIVPETGASVYSASGIARRELPKVDVSERGAVSIARRVLDPLNELVKIDPKSLGIGQYQHDVDQKELDQSLNFVVKKCVNQFGVYLNNASSSLLAHVAGLNESLANNILDFREEHGFFDINDLYKVNGIGEKTFQEAAGFIRISDSKNLLDMTLIHPEQYDAALAIIEATGKNIFSWNELPKVDRETFINNLDIKTIQMDLKLDKHTAEDMIDELILFGQDPRGIKEFVDLTNSPDSIHELKEGVVLSGEVRNVVDFGCFVDIGIKQNGLVHISKMANRYISSPHSIVKVGDHVKVRVLTVDTSRKRISLELIDVNGFAP